jgi:hypothetical protein
LSVKLPIGFATHRAPTKIPARNISQLPLTAARRRCRAPRWLYADYFTTVITGGAEM